MAIESVFDQLISRQLGVPAWCVTVDFIHEMRKKEAEYEGIKTEATLQALRRIWATEVVRNGPTPCIRR